MQIKGKLKGIAIALSVLFLAALIMLAAGAFLFMGPRMLLSLQKIEIDGGGKCWNIPPDAQNIDAKGSYLHFTSQFDINEEQLRSYAKSRGWPLSEISGPFAVNLPSADKEGRQATKLVHSGLIYDGMTCKGGFIVVYDRDARKGYIEYSHG